MPPHLRSTYAAQFDHEFPEDDLKVSNQFSNNLTKLSNISTIQHHHHHHHHHHANTSTTGTHLPHELVAATITAATAPATPLLATKTKKQNITTHATTPMKKKINPNLARILNNFNK